MLVCSLSLSRKSSLHDLRERCRYWCSPSIAGVLLKTDWKIHGYAIM